MGILKLKFNETFNFLFTQSIYMVFFRIFGILLQTIAIFTIANLVSIEKMGIFSLLIGIFSTTKVLGCFGTDLLLIKSLSSKYSLKDQNVKLSTASLLITIFFSFVLFLILCPIFYYFIQKTLLFITFFYIFFGSIVGYFTSLFRGYGKNLISFLPDLVLSNLIFLLLIFISKYLFDLSIEVIIYIHLLSIFIGLFFYTLILINFKIKIIAKISLSEVFKIVNKSISFFLSSSFVSIYVKLPLFISAILYTSAFTAILDISTRISSIPVIITNSISNFYANYFSKNYYDKNYKELKKFLYASSFISSIGSILSCLILISFGKYIILVFLPQTYEATYNLIIIFSFAYVSHCSLSISSTFMLMTDSEKIISIISFLQIILLIALSFLLSFEFDELSLILSIIISMIFKDLLTMILAIKKLSGLN